MLIEQKLNNINNNLSIKKSFFSNSSLHFSSETNQSLRDFQVKYQQSQFESRESHIKYENLLIKIIIYLFSRLKNDLESSRKGIELHQNELSHLRQQLSQTEQNRIELQNEFEQTKHQCRQYERQISEKDESKKNLDILIDQYRQQLTNEKELRLSKN